MISKVNKANDRCPEATQQLGLDEIPELKPKEISLKDVTLQSLKRDFRMLMRLRYAAHLLHLTTLDKSTRYMQTVVRFVALIFLLQRAKIGRT